MILWNENKKIQIKMNKQGILLSEEDLALKAEILKTVRIKAGRELERIEDKEADRILENNSGSVFKNDIF